MSLPFIKPGTIGTCPEDDIIPPANGGITCGVVNVYEEYCSPYCDLGYEILGSTDEYMKCNLATGWQWSHVVDGYPPPICMRSYHFQDLFLMFNASRYSPSLFPTRARC